MKIELEIQEKPKPNVIERNAGSTDAIYNLAEVQAIKNATQEHFLLIGMDNLNNVKNITLVGIGNCKEVKIDSKDIVRTALVTGSQKVVFVHNHPSNSLVPSNSDLHITNYTSKLLKVFNITMVDHIIVTENDYHSMGKFCEINLDFNDTRLDFKDNTLLKEENEKLKNENKKLKQNLKDRKKLDR